MHIKITAEQWSRKSLIFQEAFRRNWAFNKAELPHVSLTTLLQLFFFLFYLFHFFSIMENYSKWIIDNYSKIHRNPIIYFRLDDFKEFCVVFNFFMEPERPSKTRCRCSKWMVFLQITLSLSFAWQLGR